MAGVNQVEKVFPIANRVCSMCEEEKPLEEFEKRKDRPLGYGYRCKACNRARKRKQYRATGTVLQKCGWCSRFYSQVNKNHKFCSSNCRAKSEIETSLIKYLQRLVNPQRKAEGLNGLVLYQLWQEQNGLCALSGVPMTHAVGGKGTNISIDRIEAGGLYTPDNIQLVCKAVNSFRNNLSVEEFIHWCEQVVKYNGQ